MVVNPTHFSVALKYDRDTMAAPRVVAKGVDQRAMRIRQIARENGVPIVSKPPLARALFRQVKVGRSVPGELFQAVAEVLAYVYQLRRLHQVGGRVPVRPTDLPVPAELDPGPQPGPDDEPEDA